MNCKDLAAVLIFIIKAINCITSYGWLLPFSLSFLFVLLCSLFRLYWKIKYVSRLQYLWDDIKKGEIEIPDFVRKHDDILEHRPLTDYGIEPDPFHLTGMPSLTPSFGKYEDRWGARDYASEHGYHWIIIWSQTFVQNSSDVVFVLHILLCELLYLLS